MAEVKAFKAIRPNKEIACKVAALPYDVMNYEEAKQMAEGNPYSFLHIDRAEIDLEEGINPYDKKVYEKAKSNLDSFIKDEVFIKDDKPNLYIYRQIMNGRVQTGIVACTAVDDYLNEVIKKHEFTREDKEQDRINHVDYCNANTGAIFLTYKKNIEISNIVASETEKKPEYEFTTDDGITHIIWVIENDEVINKISLLFKNVESLYIADGHHRAAAAAKVGVMRREKAKNYSNEEFNYFLSVLYPDEELKIFDYNRVVSDLNGLTVDEFLNKVNEKFYIEKAKGQVKPVESHTFGMYLENTWYKLKAKEGSFNEKDTVAALDVSILQDNLLAPVLDIKNPRTDKRIDFVGGIRGIGELERRANSDMKLAFSMYPTTIKELMTIADEKRVMPPKSTWFEPKIRSGIFIHSLK